MRISIEKVKVYKSALLLFIAAFAFFSMFTPLGQVVSDTAYSVETAKSIVYRKSLSIDKNWELRFPKPGNNGTYYSKYGIGYTVSFVPQICIAKVISIFAPRQKDTIERLVISFTNTFYAACIAVLLYLLFVKLGYRPRICLITVFVICVSSILLPYSKIIQSETLTTFLMLLFLYFAAGNNKIGVWGGAIAGCIVSGLYLIKIPNIVMAMVIAVYVAVQIKKGNYTRKGIVVFIILSLLPLAMVFYLNVYRFGSFLNFGYGTEQSQFSTPLIQGLVGLLFSPSKSLFIFSPLLIFGLFSLKTFYVKHRSIASIIIAWSILDIFFYALWHDWQGGWAWGPRLIVPVMILLHIFCIEIFSALKNRAFLKIIVALVFFAGAGEQFLGSMVSYQQIHYFYDDPYSIENSQITVAGKLFVHKVQGKKEIYTCEDFNKICGEKPYQRDGKLFGGGAYNFEDRATFKGFSTLWSGMHCNFGWKYIEYFPLILLLVSAFFFQKAWKTIPTI